jgi:hypothetical protein
MLPEGTYALLGETRSGKVGVVSGLAVARAKGLEDVRLKVSPGAKLRLRADSGSIGARIAIPAGADFFVGDVIQVEKGGMEEVIVPAGVVKVAWFDESRRTDEIEVAVRAGETKDVRLGDH